MRPTDENQAASTRPNLMSSRRGAGEDNILAMLERDSARRSGARLSRARLAWYCAAAAFSGILVGVVAWLAYDNHETASAMQVQVQAERVPEGDLVQPPPALAEALPADAASAAASLEHAPEPAQPAVIVDQPHTSHPAPPPLVMLPPEQLDKASPPAAPLAAEAAPAPAPKAAKADQPEPPPRIARTDKSDKADKAARPAARANKPPQRSAAKAPTPSRTRKPAPAGTPEAGVDSDVALISAIIQHAERHRGEREGAAPCSGSSCPQP